MIDSVIRMGEVKKEVLDKYNNLVDDFFNTDTPFSKELKELLKKDFQNTVGSLIFHAQKSVEQMASEEQKVDRLIG